VALSWQYPRYGYRRIRALLAQEGWPVSRKQVLCWSYRSQWNGNQRASQTHCLDQDVEPVQ